MTFDQFYTNKSFHLLGVDRQSKTTKQKIGKEKTHSNADGSFRGNPWGKFGAAAQLSTQNSNDWEKTHI